MFIKTNQNHNKWKMLDWFLVFLMKLMMSFKILKGMAILIQFIFKAEIEKFASPTSNFKQQDMKKESLISSQISFDVSYCIQIACADGLLFIYPSQSYRYVKFIQIQWVVHIYKKDSFGGNSFWCTRYKLCHTIISNIDINIKKIHRIKQWNFVSEPQPDKTLLAAPKTQIKMWYW